MRLFSIGGGLVLRQFLFLALIVALGAAAYVGAHGVTDDVRALVESLDGKGSPETIMLANMTADAASRLSLNLLGGIAAACILILAVSMPVMHRTIAMPVQTLAATMTEIASGRTDVEINNIERKDEIGDISRALVILRDGVAQNNRMVEELKAADDQAARLMREAAIRRKVEEFSGELTQLTSRLGDMTRRMADSSETMIVSSRSAEVGSGAARAASTEAASDVASVANASEQLLESIGEISRQVVQSNEVVKRAVMETQDTNAGMARLSAAARRVGDVVSLISKIASQTNLLALNAAIEAARAGDAGRGFAVVAQEVKNLATQTTKATQDIAEQIADMQKATEASVAAISTIQSKIAEVEHISSIIAAAVHEQSASTQDIARNVRSAAAGAKSMADHAESVAEAMKGTGSSVESVVGFAHELDEVAGRLRTRARDFADALKAA